MKSTEVIEWIIIQINISNYVCEKETKKGKVRNAL